MLMCGYPIGYTAKDAKTIIIVSSIVFISYHISRVHKSQRLPTMTSARAEEEYDSINIKGTPNIQEKISPCVHGDLGTVAIAVNCIPKVINAPPGLLNMRNLPPPSAIVDDARVLLNM
jgi:hypothetical protein